MMESKGIETTTVPHMVEKSNIKMYDEWTRNGVFISRCYPDDVRHFVKENPYYMYYT